MSREIRNLIGEIRELIAFWHWFSNLVALLTLMSERGITEGAIAWIISGLVSGLIAEIVQTVIPSYLRPIFKYLLGWD